MPLIVATFQDVSEEASSVGKVWCAVVVFGVVAFVSGRKILSASLSAILTVAFPTSDWSYAGTGRELHYLRRARRDRPLCERERP